jgi:hypothetical protein
VEQTKVSAKKPHKHPQETSVDYTTFETAIPEQLQHYPAKMYSKNYNKTHVLSFRGK